MDTKGITITTKNLGLWVMIATIIVGSIVDSALTRSQVAKNTKQLEANPPEVIVVNQENMAGDIREMKTDLKDLVKAWNEWMRSQ